MQVDLPIVHPPIETYQGNSFILGILLAHQNTSCVYSNNYINISCKDTTDTFYMNLMFTKSMWEDYRVCGIAEMNLYNTLNIGKMQFVDFLKERINQGCYLLFYSADEYYLSYTKHYNKDHFMHDSYVYGYDNETFSVMAYQNNKLSEIKVPYQEICEAVYSSSFCTFRPNHSIQVNVNLDLIYQEYQDYYNAVFGDGNQEGVVYGINTYDVLADCLKMLINCTDLERKKIDPRPFRCLWEHKKVMKDRFAMLNEKYRIGYKMISLADELDRIAYTVFMLVLKFNITQDDDQLKGMIQYLTKMKEKELQCRFVD